MRSISHHRFHRSTGFSLVEIMVGMAIGMIGILVMMQVFSASEANKRITTGGDDALNSGTIALYSLQRDIRQGGYDISAVNLLGCDVVLRTGVTLNALAPVTINQGAVAGVGGIPAGDANTDTLLIVYGNAAGSPQGDVVIQQPMSPSNATYTVTTPTSFKVGDLIIAEPQSRPSPCSLRLTKVVTADSSGSDRIVADGLAGMANGTLYNLGQAPKILAYAIRRGNLTVCDYMQNDCSDSTKTADTTIWVPIANNIVSMRAEYGRDTSSMKILPANAVVDTYDQSTPTNACSWSRTAAVRIAVVARSGEYDKNNVTLSAPVWASSTNTIVLTADANWQHYRYRVFQTVVPIRNVAWMGVLAGC